jgi:hypothetical protein
VPLSNSESAWLVALSSSILTLWAAAVVALLDGVPSDLRDPPVLLLIAGVLRLLHLSLTPACCFFQAMSGQARRLRQALHLQLDMLHQQEAVLLQEEQRLQLAVAQHARQLSAWSTWALAWGFQIDAHAAALQDQRLAVTQALQRVRAERVAASVSLAVLEQSGKTAKVIYW